MKQALRHTIRRFIPALLVVATLATSIGAYRAVTVSPDPFGGDQERVLGWVLANMLLLLSLAFFIIYRISSLWMARRKNSVGSRLQLRIIKRFGLMTIVPILVVAVFASVYLHFGVQSWFNERVGRALNESVAVAEGYLAEHKNIISADALAMANDLNRQAYQLMRNPRALEKMTNTQAALRALSEALILQRDRDIVARSSLSFSLSFSLNELTEEQFKRADAGEVVVLTTDDDDRVRALLKLNNYVDAYLLVGRLIDSKLLQHMENAMGSVAEYQHLRENIATMQLNFSLLFVAVALVLVLSSVWYGMVIASNLVAPISDLVKATERVKAGDYRVRVKEGPENDEIATLGRAFNRMTSQLEKQRGELVEVNAQIDDRRRFIEAVLSGASAGVVALDAIGTITLLNPSAGQLLALEDSMAKGTLLAERFPAFKPLIDKAEASKNLFSQGNIDIDVDGNRLGLHVRVVAESDEAGKRIGFVVTFDDVTELHLAQRRAAWADIARRIAHEIRNPLTPIQLAAERLLRKHKKEHKEGGDASYVKYIDTITRHVGDIRNMVEEFATYARMPAPKFAMHDLRDTMRAAIFAQKHVYNDISFILQMDEANPLELYCDGGQMNQIFTNILKNSAEAFEKYEGDKKITLSAEKVGNEVVITCADTGPGFPPQLLNRLTEPYVTTREKGTGLGLAIVKKIVDDHGGKLILNNLVKNGKTTGAQVQIRFPQAG